MHLWLGQPNKTGDLCQPAGYEAIWFDDALEQAAPVSLRRDTPDTRRIDAGDTP
jgi:hypothetical protein